MRIINPSIYVFDFNKNGFDFWDPKQKIRLLWENFLRFKDEEGEMSIHFKGNTDFKDKISIEEFYAQNGFYPETYLSFEKGTQETEELFDVLRTKYKEYKERNKK